MKFKHLFSLHTFIFSHQSSKGRSSHRNGFSKQYTTDTFQLLQKRKREKNWQVIINCLVP